MKLKNNIFLPNKNSIETRYASEVPALLNSNESRGIKGATNGARGI